MKKALRNLFLLGLGATISATAIINKDKIKKEIDNLVKKGELKAKEGKELLNSLVKSAKETQKKVSKQIENEVKKQIKKLGYVKKNSVKKATTSNVRVVKAKKKTVPKKKVVKKKTSSKKK